MNACLAIGILGLAGCASNRFAEATRPNQVLAGLDKRLEAARDQQWDWVSPEHFVRADDACKAAHVRLKENRSRETVLESAELCAQELELVESVAKTHSASLRPLLAGRQAALTAQAHEVFSSEFENADERLRTLGVAMEGGEAEDSGSWKTTVGSLVRRYRELEIQAVKKSALADARQAVERSEASGARTTAPRTLEEAIRSYNAAIYSIEAHRGQSPDELPEVQAAREASQKLEWVVSAVQNESLSESEAIKKFNSRAVTESGGSNS